MLKSHLRRRDQRYRLELDYLQVFVIETKQNTERDGKVLEITHSQEVPEYSKTYEIPIKNEDVSIDGKMFVIDDVTHATMLWAEEYQEGGARMLSYLITDAITGVVVIGQWKLYMRNGRYR